MSSSNYVGVSKIGEGKFTAQLKVVKPPEKRTLASTTWRIGTFNSELFAAIVRDIAAAAYWGRSQYLRYNFFEEEHLPEEGAVAEHPAWKWTKRNEKFLDEIRVNDEFLRIPCQHPAARPPEGCICEAKARVRQENAELWAKIKANT